MTWCEYCPANPSNCYFIVNAWLFLTNPPPEGATEGSTKALARAHQAMQERHQIWKTTAWSQEVEKTTRRYSLVAPINTLPPEILEAFFSFLPVPMVMQCTLVCCQWHQLIADNQNLWRTLYSTRVGEERAQKKAPFINNWKEAYIKHAYPKSLQINRNPRKRNKPRKPGSKMTRERQRKGGRTSKEHRFNN